MSLFRIFSGFDILIFCFQPPFPFFRYFDALICVLRCESRLYCLRRVIDIHVSICAISMASLALGSFKCAL